MLTAMRKGSDNWFIKIFLGIVILGFIATGGLVSYSAVQSNNYVVNVGEANVTIDTFNGDYARDVNDFSRRIGGQNIQPAFLKLIEQTVITRLVNRATMENTGKLFDMSIDDKIIAKSITADPAFQSSKGSFDKAVFDGILLQNRMSERDYVSLIKKQQIIDQLTVGLANIEISPEIYVNIINEFNNQQRIAEYFHIKSEHIEIGETPTGDALNTYYQSVIEQFDAPEYRKVELLEISPLELAKTIVVDDELLKEQYELLKSTFNTNEKRQISQLIYNNQADAQAAFEKIAKGATFLDLANDANISETAYKLGEFEQANLPIKAMADKSFELTLNEISEPLNLGLSYALLQVTKITPAVIKTFNDVKANIQKSEALRLATDKVYDLRDDVEDEIAGGASFSEVAAKLSIKFSAIEAIDSASLNMSGTSITLPTTLSLLRGIFSSDEALDNEPVDSAAAGLVWYKVTKITKSRNKDLSEVQNKVISLWRSSETQKALLAKAKELAEKAGNIDELSKAYSDEIKLSSALKRNITSLQLSAKAIDALFAIKQGSYAYVADEIEGKDAFIIMQLKEIIEPDNNDMTDIYLQMRKQIGPNLAATLIESYIENNKQIYGTSINQPLIDRITGVQPQY